MLPKIRTRIFFRLFIGMIVSRKMSLEWRGVIDRGLGLIRVRVCEAV